MPEERKLVTILFADVTGSTALGESLDPEDVRALMGRYYEHAHDIIAAYFFLGEYIQSIAVIKNALLNPRPDDSSIN